LTDPSSKLIDPHKKLTGTPAKLIDQHPAQATRLEVDRTP